MTDENPYLIFFLHLELYGLIGLFQSGDLSYQRVKEMAEHHNISTNLLWKVACKA